MSKVSIVYWSGTGNTEAMANAVADGVKEAGAQADVISAENFNADMMDEYDAIAFGCPSMGVEVLEEDVFEPMFEACKEKLSGKKIALFGSYGWGDGEWMNNWEEECKALGADMPVDFVICNEMPDEAGLKDCMELGRGLC